MTTYAELLPMVPTRGEQARTADLTASILVGMTAEGHAVTAEYDDGGAYLDSGEMVMVMELLPMCISVHRPGMVVDYYPSGSAQVNFPYVNSRGVVLNRSTLLEGGRPVAV